MGIALMMRRAGLFVAVPLSFGIEIISSESGGIGNISGAFDLGFTQALEREADYHGLRLAHQAGYDIRGGVDIWERFAVEEPIFQGHLRLKRDRIEVSFRREKSKEGKFSI